MAFLFDRESVAIEDLRSRISLSRRRMLRIGAVSLAAPISVRLLGAQAQSCAPNNPLLKLFDNVPSITQ